MSLTFATLFRRVIPRYSTSKQTPPDDFEVGEVVVNFATDQIYAKHPDGTVYSFPGNSRVEDAIFALTEQIAALGRALAASRWNMVEPSPQPPMLPSAITNYQGYVAAFASAQSVAIVTDGSTRKTLDFFDSGTGAHISSLATASTPFLSAFGATSGLFCIGAFSPSEVLFVDPATQSLVKTLSTVTYGPLPRDVIYVPSLQLFAVLIAGFANVPNSSGLLLIDEASREVLSWTSVQAHGTNLRGLVYQTNQNRFVIGVGNSAPLILVDAATLAVTISSVAFPGVHYLRTLEDADSSDLIVASLRGTLKRVDSANWSDVWSSPLGGALTWVDYSPESESLLVSGWDLAIVKVISAADGALMKNLPLPTGVDRAYGITKNPVTGNYWAALGGSLVAQAVSVLRAS